MQRNCSKCDSSRQIVLTNVLEPPGEHYAMLRLALPWQKTSSVALPSRRLLHLAPPFLLDSYTPRYQSISSVDSSRKRSLAYAHLRNCNLCPRLCSVNRYEKTGHCLIGAETVKVNVIGPHFGEVDMPMSQRKRDLTSFRRSLVSKVTMAAAVCSSLAATFVVSFVRITI